MHRSTQPVRSILSSIPRPGRLGIPLLVCAVALAVAVGCGGSGSASSMMGGGGSTGGGGTTSQTVATPTIATTAAQNSAVIVNLKDATASSTIYYTLDGSTPTTSSPQYVAPFLVDSNVTLNVMATASGDTNSTVATQTFSPNIPSGTLVWSDEFSNSGSANAQPNPSTWTYDTGLNCCGNNEQETYCAWGATSGGCSTANPNAYVGTDGYLHITALNPSSGVYTSARLKTEGLFSFQYGRIEARIKVPESQGMWPAFCLLGNNITTNPWPACGEADIMEHIDGATPPINGIPASYDWVQASVHGTGLNGGTPYHASGFSAADWHTYGMIWSKGKIEYYIDSPSNVYETFTASSMAGTWPFDQGPMFILLNLAVGGTWPGDVNSSTVFPGNMLVDYVRIYTN